MPRVTNGDRGAKPGAGGPRERFAEMYRARHFDAESSNLTRATCRRPCRTTTDAAAVLRRVKQRVAVFEIVTAVEVPTAAYDEASRRAASSSSTSITRTPFCGRPSTCTSRGGRMERIRTYASSTFFSTRRRWSNWTGTASRCGSRPNTTSSTSAESPRACSCAVPRPSVRGRRTDGGADRPDRRQPERVARTRGESMSEVVVVAEIGIAEGKRRGGAGRAADALRGDAREGQGLPALRARLHPADQSHVLMIEKWSRRSSSGSTAPPTSKALGASGALAGPRR